MKKRMKKLHSRGREEIDKYVDKFMKRQARYMTENPEHYKEVSPEDFVIWLLGSDMGDLD